MKINFPIQDQPIEKQARFLFRLFWKEVFSEIIVKNRREVNVRGEGGNEISKIIIKIADFIT